MEDIYYLTHVTDNPDCILWDKLKACDFNTNDQFPGVYMSVITKDNIDSERIFPGKYIMIFSKTLLFQRNYHINARDYNGIITEKNTFYPHTLNEFLANNANNANEIIFHDDISIRYCCNIITKSNNNTTILPKISFKCYEQPDMTKLPFYCYPFEDIYTGINPLCTSSIEWYIMMAKIADITLTENNNINNIREKIKEKAKDLYLHRYKQKIYFLEKYKNI